MRYDADSDVCTGFLPAIMARLPLAATFASILIAILAVILWKSGEQRQIFGLRLAKFSSTPSRQSKPDTTAVVLNWSRLPNVIRIASLLCENTLDDVIASVVVWNNNPKALTYEVRTLYALSTPC